MTRQDAMISNGNRDRNRDGSPFEFGMMAATGGNPSSHTRSGPGHSSVAGKSHLLPASQSDAQRLGRIFSVPAKGVRRATAGAQQFRMGLKGPVTLRDPSLSAVLEWPG